MDVLNQFDQNIHVTQHLLWETTGYHSLSQIDNLQGLLTRLQREGTDVDAIIKHIFESETSAMDNNP